MIEINFHLLFLIFNLRYSDFILNIEPILFIYSKTRVKMFIRLYKGIGKMTEFIFLIFVILNLKLLIIRDRYFI